MELRYADATGTYRDSDGSDEVYSYSKDLALVICQAGFNFGLLVLLKAPQLTYRRYELFFLTGLRLQEFSMVLHLILQSWKAPGYGIVDLNASYDLPFEFGGASATVVLNVRNLFDEVYVQDALDNSRFNARPFRVNDHSANAAEVFLGMPTAFNLGLKVNF